MEGLQGKGNILINKIIPCHIAPFIDIITMRDLDGEHYQLIMIMQ